MSRVRNHPAAAPVPAPAAPSPTIHYLLSSAGRSFLRGFIGSIIILAPGVLAAPNLDNAVVLGVAALAASIAAGLNTLQEFVPLLSWEGLLAHTPLAAYTKIMDSFTRIFLGTLLVSLTGWLKAPDLSTSRAFAVAALVGAVTAGIRAVQGYLTKGDFPAPASGT